MIKKYVVLIAVSLVILMFTSTSTASFLLSEQTISERFGENSVFYKVFNKISNIVSYKQNIVNNEDNNIVDGEITPDNGNEIVFEENDLEDTPTIDIDGPEGTTLNDEPTIDENGEIGTTLDRIIEIITGQNENIGAMLQRIVEHVYAPGTTESNTVAENIVNNVVVNGDATGTAENNNAEVVVLTANDQ